ncbi:hypothetical protein VaNZ11_001525 [Volvox africanus]|uniref:BZIP domain-containing protein n=1 Tax=Volvox africanus TaxID=51714 RepID=A0ABQ5RPV8_9CHLO|nr:hypothetical protein VaNZ11_001525 [Volvox africanus]
MELSTQHPFGIHGGLGGRGRFAGMVSPNGVQEVTIGETGVGQLPGTNADAELEELCSSLPGWHQQQSSHDPGGLLGGLARTVSAPSAFLLSASRGVRSPGINCPVDGLSGLSTAPHQDNYSGHFQCMGEFSSVQRQAPVPGRWLLQGQPTVGNNPLQNSNFATAEVTDAGSLSAGNNTLPTDDQPWPPRPAHWSTMLPPGEQHTTAMLHSLVHFEPGLQNEANGQPSSRRAGRAAQHIPNAGGGGAGAGAGSCSGGGCSQRSSHFGNLPTDISDWPSGGRLLGGSSGMQIMPGASGSASALSGPLSGPFFTGRQANSCGEPLRAGEGSCAVDLAVCTTTRGSPAPSTGHGAMLTAPLRVQGKRPGSPELRMGPSVAGGAGGTGLQIMDMMAEGEVMAEGVMQLDMEQDGNGAGGLRSASSGSSMCAAVNGALITAAGCDADGSAGMYPDAATAAAAAGFGGGPNVDTAAVMMADDGDGDGRKATGGGKAKNGGSGKVGRSGNGDGLASRAANSDDGRTPCEVDAPCGEGGLQLLAMRFRNRPGRVPKAVAKLGPIAELAKSAASGKIKLEREELEDLVMTVETSLARAVTEQKEDSRARNRVAQQRFRNRQRETIAALQAKVEEQEALILTLQEKIRWYETAQQQRQQQQQQQPQAHQRDGGAPAAVRGGRATRRALHD